MRLARDPGRVQQAPTVALVAAAAVLAKALVAVIDGGGLKAQRASAMGWIDPAGRVIGEELRKRRTVQR